MQKTPTKIPTARGSGKITRKNSQIPDDFAYAAKVDGKYSNFSDLSTQRHARILRLQDNNIVSFQGLKNFSNLRIIDLQNNPVNFSKTAILVAFRSLNIQTINGQHLEPEDLQNSFNYSGLVTYALRQGMDPELCGDDIDPETALTHSLDFLHQIQDTYSFDPNDQRITVKIEGDLYTWFVLDDEFQWRPIEGDNNTIVNNLNYPLRCEVKHAYIGKKKTGKEVPTMNVYIPEHDSTYHVFAELTGNPAEGDIISVKAPLSSTIEWRHVEDDAVLKSGSLVLPLTADDVGHVIICDITPGVDLPSTRLMTEEVKPGEFRFKSLRLQGQLIENDEIEFDISTKGTKAIFKGIRILRSARHGDWENIDFIQSSEGNNPNEKLKYKLTVQDIGCVIRAVCITEGGGPPLMLTSSERVQPSSPRFTSGNIFGAMTVGMPIFAIAHYEGGVQGNCRYEWSIGGSKTRPVIVPTEADVGKTLSCLMTPIRSDGSIGPSIEITCDKQITTFKGNPLQEKFLVFHKKTKTGKMQMSIIDERPSEQLNSIHENETIIVSQVVDWAVVDENGVHTVGNSKIFKADKSYIKGIVVVFTDTFFAIAGIVEAAPPTANNVQILCDKESAFLSTTYDYSGGIEGRSIIQWNRNDGRGETVVAFGKSFHIGLGDRGCTFRVVVIPVSLDGRRGAPTPSEPILIDDSCITLDEKPVMVILPPDEVLNDVPVKLVFQEDPMPDSNKITYVTTNLPITKRNTIVWQINNKTVAKGNTYTPTLYDLGKVITVSVLDRIRQEVIAKADLPKVDSEGPSVKNVYLTIEKVQNNEKKWVNLVKVYSEFSGGIEGKSIIIWKGIKPGETEPKECARNNRKWIELNETWDNAQIGVEYVPYNTTSDQPGHHAESPFITVPPLITKKVDPVTIKSVKFVPNKEYNQLKCEVETTGKCHVQYDWGYIFEGEHQYTDESTNIHQITQDDFDFQPFCGLRILDEKNRLILEQLCDVTPTIPELFEPKVSQTSIVPVEKEVSKKDQKEPKEVSKELMHGQEITAIISDYQGPPYKIKSIHWEREEGTEWKSISDDEVYTTSMNDYMHNIRATLLITINHKLFEQPKNYEFVTNPVKITGKNRVIRRIAKSLKRTKKASFDAKLPLGEKVTILFENGNLIMRSGQNILLRSPYPTVSIDIKEGTQSTIALRARHGYNTELTFDEKKMSGGTKFSAAQTRELFYRVLHCFQKTK